MRRTAKLFKNGRSQAVRLPAEFRFKGKEVFIRKDEQSGEVILSEPSRSWDEFFKLRDEAIRLEPEIAAQFLADRKDEPPEDRHLFDDWQDPEEPDALPAGHKRRKLHDETK